MALWRSTFIVSAMTMLSRVLGLVRDMVLLNVFGAGKDFDTFVVAFRIPNFFRRLFAEGAFSRQPGSSPEPDGAHNALQHPETLF